MHRWSRLSRYFYYLMFLEVINNEFGGRSKICSLKKYLEYALRVRRIVKGKGQQFSVNVCLYNLTVSNFFY